MTEPPIGRPADAFAETPVAAWRRCRRYIEAALARAGGTHGLEDVERLIGEGRAHFWPGRRCAVVTEFYRYPRLKACNLAPLGYRPEWIIYGKDLSP